MLEVLVYDHDVRVTQRPRELRLAQEPLLEQVVAGAKHAQLLECDKPIEIGLAGEVHGGHPTVAQHVQDLVAPNPAHNLGHEGRS